MTCFAHSPSPAPTTNQQAQLEWVACLQRLRLACRKATSWPRRGFPEVQTPLSFVSLTNSEAKRLNCGCLHIVTVDATPQELPVTAKKFGLRMALHPLMAHQYRLRREISV